MDFRKDRQISSLRPIEIKVIDDIVDFARGRGYVLDFSDREMSHFFGVLGIDIDDPAYAENGGSKGNRLRTFLRKTDDGTANRVLQALDCQSAPKKDPLSASKRDPPFDVV